MLKHHLTIGSGNSICVRMMKENLRILFNLTSKSVENVTEGCEMLKTMLNKLII